MDTLVQNIDLFKHQGGELYIPVSALQEKVLRARAFVFDWDGVFNAGLKSKNGSGTFSEADSMGVNMLRYGCWRKNGEQPFMAIISGESDKTASLFAEREHFNAAYTGIANKKDALDALCQSADIKPEQVVCVFDDINDIPMAKHCGLRIQIRRKSSPMFIKYAAGRYSDYLTASQGGEHAVREFCELFMAAAGSFADTIDSRIAFDDEYKAYWEKRNTIKTTYRSWKDGKMVTKDQRRPGFLE
ncbi:MAG: HAD hydrolase family protein [bacterium]|nr:HAD hydrolase family protein [bacterium]